jgi:hypothetical protein
MVAVLALTLSFAPARSYAADGDPFPGFGVNGVVNEVPNSPVDSSFWPTNVTDDFDGSLLVSGYFASTVSFIAKYTITGQRDPAFGVNGITRVGGGANGGLPLSKPVVLPDGTIVVADGQPSLLLVSGDGKHLADLPIPRQPAEVGSLSLAQSLVPFPDGRVAVVATDWNRTNLIVSMLLPTGDFDPTYNAESLRASGTDVGGALLTDGRLIVSTGGNTQEPHQCAYTVFDSRGFVDPSFGTAGTLAAGVSNSCQIVPEPSGSFLVPLSVNVWSRYSADGVLLQNLNLPFQDGYQGQVAVEGTGRILSASGPTGVAALNPDGTPDTSFTPGWQALTNTFRLPPKLSVLANGDVALFGTDAFGGMGLALISSPWGSAPQPPALPMTKFVPAAPVRVLDTRSGLGAPPGKPGAGGQIDLRLARFAGTPLAAVRAVVLNVVATDATGPGFVTVWPTGTPRPVISSLNVERAGQTVANLVTVKVGANGRVSMFTLSGTHLVADVQGYYIDSGPASDGRFVPAASPTRLLDTRDNAAYIAGGGTTELAILGAGPVPLTGVSAVALNITVTDNMVPGFFTVWPSGIARPVASSLNVAAGDTRANMVIVPVGENGKISIFSQSGGDVIADVAGWFTDGSAPIDIAGLYVPITPTRVLDTRYYTTPINPDTSGVLVLGGTQMLPPYSAAAAVVINATVTQATNPGFFTFWPAGLPRPLVSNLNATSAGQTVPNAAIVPLHFEAMSVYVQSGAHVIIDLFGYYMRY